MSTSFQPALHERIYRWTFDHTTEIRKRTESIWGNAWFGWLLIGSFTGIYAFWRWHLPSPGKAVAALGVLATIIAFRKSLGGVEKFICMILLILFLLLEFNSIDKDRADHDVQQARSLKEQGDSFKKVLGNQQAGFKQTLDQEQMHF
jgi:hypothetical protein